MRDMMRESGRVRDTCIACSNVIGLWYDRLSEVTQSRNLHDKEQLAHVPNVVASAHPDRHSRDIREGTIRQIRGRFNTVSVRK